jgi:hypothetical protein
MEEDERLVGQVLHGHCRQGGGAMPFRQDGEQGIAVQALRPKPAAVRSRHGPCEPDIEPPVPEPVDLRRRRHLMQGEPNTRKTPTVLTDHPR